MREKIIERKLVQEVKAMRGIALKIVGPGFNGMPDRFVILPRGRIAFVEVKVPGMKPRPLQIKRHEMLRRLGCKVYVLDDEEQIKQMLSEIMRGGDTK